jgi:hypothetical protein
LLQQENCPCMQMNMLVPSLNGQVCEQKRMMVIHSLLHSHSLTLSPQSSLPKKKAGHSK